MEMRKRRDREGERQNGGMIVGGREKDVEIDRETGGEESKEGSVRKGIT